MREKKNKRLSTDKQRSSPNQKREKRKKIEEEDGGGKKINCLYRWISFFHSVTKSWPFQKCAKLDALTALTVSKMISVE